MKEILFAILTAFFPMEQYTYPSGYCIHSFKQIRQKGHVYEITFLNDGHCYTDKKTFDAFMNSRPTRGLGHCTRLYIRTYSWGRFATLDDRPPLRYTYCALP